MKYQRRNIYIKYKDTYTYAHTHSYAHAYTFIRTRTCTHRRANTHTCTHTHTHTHRYTHTQIVYFHPVFWAKGENWVVKIHNTNFQCSNFARNFFSIFSLNYGLAEICNIDTLWQSDLLLYRPHLDIIYKKNNWKERWNWGKM